MFYTTGTDYTKKNWGTTWAQTLKVLGLKATILDEGLISQNGGRRTSQNKQEKS